MQTLTFHSLIESLRIMTDIKIAVQKYNITPLKKKRKGIKTNFFLNKYYDLTPASN